jgi:selenide,water dikinase
VTGEVHPDRVWANAGAKPGDVLLLTKALGTGIIATALKAGRAPADAVTAAVASMLTLNRAACEALLALPDGTVHACTDVTGFGLVGHGCEMAVASGVTLRIRAEEVPLLDGVLPLVAGNVPGGGRTNAEHFAPDVAFAAELDIDRVKVLHDPQTSGGLLVAVPADRVAATQARLAEAGVDARRIGDVLAPAASRLILT